MTNTASTVAADDDGSFSARQRFGALAPLLDDLGYDYPVPLQIIPNPRSDEEAKKRKAPEMNKWNLIAKKIRDTWPKLYPDSGVGLRTGNGIMFIDSDTDLEESAEIVCHALVETWGDVMLARGRPGSHRFATPLRCEKQYRKGDLSFHRLGDDGEVITDLATGEPIVEKIELLAEGQQVVVFAQHPSGEWYEWGGNRSLLDVPRDELPRADDASLAKFVRLVIEGMEADGWTIRGKNTIGRESSRSARRAGGNARATSSADDDAGSLGTHLFPSWEWPEELLQKMLEWRDSTDYDEWRDVMFSLARLEDRRMAVRVAEWWSARSTNPKHTDPKRTDLKDTVRRKLEAIDRGDEDPGRDDLRTPKALRDEWDSHVEETEKALLLDDATAERVEHYRERIEAGGEADAWNAIVRDMNADETMTDASRRTLRDPLRGMMRRGGLTPLSAKDMDAALTTAPAPSAPGGRIDIVGIIIEDFDRTFSYGRDEKGNPFGERVEDGRMMTYLPHKTTLNDWLVMNALPKYGRRTNKLERSEIHDHVAARGRSSGNVKAARMRYAVELDKDGAPVRVFEDVGDEDRTVIACEASGVSVAEPDPSWTFRFKTGCDAVATSPHRGVPRETIPGRVHALLASMNVPEGMEIPMIAWLVNGRMGLDQCPLLLVTGGHNSGKSWLVEQAQRLIDPQEDDQVAPSTKQPALRARLGENHMMAEHNASRYSNDMQNDLCIAADGQTLKDRKLYSDGETATTRVLGPIAISAIHSATLPNVDIVSRKLEVRVIPVAKADELGMTELRAGFRAALPEHHATLRALTAEVLRLWREVTDDRGHRHKSFNRIGNIVARIMGEPRSFAELLAVSEEGERIEAFEGSQFAQDVFHLVVDCNRNGWEGLASTLLESIKALLPDGERNRRQRIPGYPQVGRDVWKALDEIAPALSAAGVDFGRGRKTNRG